MKPLLALPLFAVLLLALLLAAVIAGSGKADPYAKYRDIQLKRGMTVFSIKLLLGEPDNYDDGWSNHPSTRFPGEVFYDYTPGKHYIQDLNYGGFGAFSQHTGHVTKYRLSLRFMNGLLYLWEKSTPIGKE